MSDGESEELVSDCKQVALDAETVHKWLKPLLQDSAATRGAYAVKDRLKPWYEIRQKVLAKRHDSDPTRRKASYSPDDITDASGFRIVSLFNSDIPGVLDKLLQLIESPLTSDAGRFKDPAIKEIIFYSSRRQGDPMSIKPQVVDVVRSHGLESVFSEPPGSASSYSSVHVIVESEAGSSPDNSSSAFSEIQLRSVFEEAWSEINHRLLYAPAKRARAETDGASPAASENQSAYLHLDVLKSFTDGCAQYADLIRQLFPDPQPSPANRSPSSLDETERSIALFKRRPPQERKLAEKAFRLRDAAEGLKDGNRHAAFEKAAIAFQEAVNKLFEDKDPPTDLYWVLQEERAYSLMFAGNEELRSQSEKIYREILAAYPQRVSALLRLGQIRRDADDYREAENLLTEALRRAEDSPEAAKSLPIIQRDLAYVYWRQVDLNPFLEEAGKLLKKAIQLTEKAYQGTNKASFKLAVCNNLLYYLLLYLPEAPDGEKDERTEQARTLLQTLRQQEDIENWTTLRLDTMMRAEYTLGDKMIARKLAEEILKRLNKAIETSPSIASNRVSRMDRLKILSRDELDVYLTAQDIVVEVAG